ncbi:probable salivary secreted peptide [Phlebotomus argentipes]|uniref:probable salivary secreted peptide n=1 Tax=Phlebotomus argentipes TaxID=94469 RepID=UPI00289319A5|nr:probable salivary secreted peptide [Phlebotomus argentipes]
MKIAVGFIVLVTFCGVLYAQSHHMQWGNVSHYDQLLHREFVRKSKSWLQTVTKEVSWPNATNIQARNRTITCIIAHDQYVNGKGGYATLRAGGVGFNHTAVRFKSQRSEGFDFIFEIYGR